MKLYLVAFAAPILALFSIFWTLLGAGVVKPADPDFWINKAHNSMIAECDLGDLDILGDSSSVADLLPSRIGPGVRDFGFDGGTPIEAYYISQAMLRCSHRPRVVLVSFVPTTLSANLPLPGHPGTFFWTEGVKFGVINMDDAQEVLVASRTFNNTLNVGARTLWDIDYRLKALLYLAKFPPYYASDIRSYALSHIAGNVAAIRAQSRDLLERTLADEGHHFFGTQADGGTDLDSDANRSGNLVSPLADFYLRRMIKAFAASGIPVDFVEPPRNLTSAIHYDPGLVANYQAYLATLQRTEPNFHIIDQGFDIWDRTLFGDARHLNLRGASIFSDEVRNSINSAGQNVITFQAAYLQTKNLISVAGGSRPIWQILGSRSGTEVRPAVNIALPALAYPTSMAWRYEAPADATRNNGVGIQSPTLGLDAATSYAASVFLKEIVTDKASLNVHWPGGTDGSITWDFRQHETIYSGTANPRNSGVIICPGDWVELYLSANSGPESTLYPGPTVALSANHHASGYLYNATVERGLWPTNYCTLKLNEAKRIPLPTEVAAKH
jgi:hypothetical protein